MNGEPLLLAAHGVRKSFDGVPALVDGRLELRAGEIHALVGENGAGKSTLMKILAGALQPDAGTLRFASRPYAPVRPRDAFACGVHLVHQELMLIEELDLAENLFLGREPTRGVRLDRDGMHRRAATILERLGVRHAPTTRLGDLSLGERQLVEIGRALTHDVRVLAMDEPTSSLTGAETERLFGVVRSLRDTGVGVVWISHRLDEIEALCDRVTTMRDGAHVRTGDVAATTRAAIVQDMVGRPVAVDAVRRTPRDRGDVLLEVHGFTDPGRYVDIDLALHRGEIVGMFGLVGSGRTEFARGLVASPPPRSGVLTVLGAERTLRGPRDALRQGIGLLSEDRKASGIIPDRSVRENVTLAALDRYARCGFIDEARERSDVAAAQRTLGIRAASLEVPIRTLSGGNQQKVLLARLLATGAPVLVVDEPTRGVDVGAKVEIHALLEQAAADGHGVLMISSDLPELLAIADRIVVFREGRRVASFVAGDVSPEAVMGAATGAFEPTEARV